MKIEESKHKFEIQLSEDWFTKGSILYTGYRNQKILILDTPKKHYAKWYHRLLRFITFGWVFKIKYTYTVKIIEQDEN